MLNTKRCMPMLQGQWISNQKCLLVQVAGSYWKHKPVTNANLFDTSQKCHSKTLSRYMYEIKSYHWNIIKLFVS